ncbi:MAG TPA: orotidine-5'-phosphate decarboxylase [Acidimicrobiia bacterium]
MVSPLIVALDVAEETEAVELAGRLRPYVGGFKVGLELLMGAGPSVVSGVVELGVPVFVDAKLHDIPNTVARAAGRLGAIGARWVTVHASGGEEMVRVAVESLSESSEGRAGALAVTVLTSLDDRDLAVIGVGRDLGDQVAAMAQIGAGAGVEGVVCAVPEASRVKRLGLGLTVVTPGIRPAGASSSDQRRVATPGQAIMAGADLLVVGRPITAAPDPVAAAVAIGEEIAAAVSAT